jgi:hypothetical protein
MPSRSVTFALCRRASITNQSLRVYQRVPFASFDLLGAIVTALPPTDARGLDRLAVHDGRAGLRVALQADSHPLAQGAVHPLPGSTQTPEAKVMAEEFPGREVVRQEPPGAATLQDVEDGVEDLAQAVKRGRPPFSGTGKSA